LLNYLKNRNANHRASVTALRYVGRGAVREASRAKSNADFISKMEGSLQELEESEYWLELLAESGFVSEERLASIKKKPAS